MSAPTAAVARRFVVNRNPAQSRSSPSSPSSPKPEPKILFQKYFKSVGPRTYAIQMKEASNGNPFIVLTEGKRDDKTDEVRKTRVFVFSEDFPAFFRMLQETAVYLREHPVPEEIKQKRARFWAKKASPPGQKQELNRR